VLTVSSESLRLRALRIWVAEDLNQPPIVPHGEVLAICRAVHSVDVGVVDDAAEDPLDRPAEVG